MSTANERPVFNEGVIRVWEQAMVKEYEKKLTMNHWKFKILAQPFVGPTKLKHKVKIRERG